MGDSGGAVAAVGRLGRAAGRLAVVGTAVLGLGGFVLSFTALRDLAVRVGMPAELAWIWPLLIDGLIIEATLAVVRLSQLGSRSVWYAWSLLAGGAVVSVGSNGVHAVATGHGAAGAAASAVAPVVLLAMTHLTVLLLRPEPAAEAAQSAPRDDVTTHQAPPDAPGSEAPGGGSGSTGTAEPAVGPAEVDLEAWVRSQEAEGRTVTGTMVAELLGCSASTGRRRLAVLRGRSGGRPRLRLAPAGEERRQA